MGRFLIQPDKERDLYILWSTVTDSPLTAGSRKTLERVLILDWIEQAQKQVSQMFDVYAKPPTGEVYQGSHWMPAKNFLAVAERIAKDPNADLSDLIEEIEE